MPSSSPPGAPPPEKPAIDIPFAPPPKVSLRPGINWVEGLATVVPDGKAMSPTVVGRATGAGVTVGESPPVVLDEEAPPVWSPGELVVWSLDVIGVSETPGTATPICASAIEAEHVNNAHPRIGDQIYCTRLALTVMGVAGHPGIGRIVGWKNVCTVPNG